jgi:hypothetical protein
VAPFGTTIHANPDGTYTSSNYKVLDFIVSNDGQTKLTTNCGFIQAHGSG